MTRVLHAGRGSRAGVGPRALPSVDIDLIRELSARVPIERKPGETQHAALQRLRAEAAMPEWYPE